MVERSEVSFSHSGNSSDVVTLCSATLGRIFLHHNFHRDVSDRRPFAQLPVLRLGTTVAETRVTRPIGDLFVIKRYLVLALSTIVTAASLGLPATASAQSNPEIEKIRAKVQTLSATKDSQVQIKFRDKTKLKGYIDSVEPVTFTLRDPKDGTKQSVSYSEVESISKASDGVSTKTWLIVGGVAAGVLTTWLVVKPAVCDGGAQSRGPC